MAKHESGRETTQKWKHTPPYLLPYFYFIFFSFAESLSNCRASFVPVFLFCSSLFNQRRLKARLSIWPGKDAGNNYPRPQRAAAEESASAFSTPAAARSEGASESATSTTICSPPRRPKLWWRWWCLQPARRLRLHGHGLEHISDECT